ncbi:MAG: DNA recombination protein RmuC [Alphaproteobacteria bacterium]
MELALAVLAGAALAVAVGALMAALGGRRRGTDDLARLAETAQALVAAQAELGGRLRQMGESQAAAQAQLAERMQAQERAVTRVMEERLGDVVRRVGEGLQKTTEKTAETMHDLRERLVLIDAAQKSISALSTQVVGLQDILANKQARGAFGEVQLENIVRNALPPSAYEFQASLGNGRRADCLLRLPNPPGAIAVDAKFPLESYHALRNAADETARKLAERAFGTAVLNHVRDIAERYIVPGETADSALLFLPSEAVYAELHASFDDVVKKSYRAKVWIVSPTTLMATLNTVRAVLKDARMREQADVIQKEVQLMLNDVRLLDERVGKLARHFDQTTEDIRQIRISTDKVTGRGERIEQVQFGDADSPADELAPPER